jgi:hypothetical protein
MLKLPSSPLVAETPEAGSRTLAPATPAPSASTTRPARASPGSSTPRPGARVSSKRPSGARGWLSVLGPSRTVTTAPSSTPPWAST